MTIQKNSIPEAYNGPMVSLQNIHKTFNPHSVNELTIFENFNLDILKDQFISVIGSNGSGQTFWFNLWSKQKAIGFLQITVRAIKIRFGG